MGAPGRNLGACLPWYSNPLLMLGHPAEPLTTKYFTIRALNTAGVSAPSAAVAAAFPRPTGPS